MTPQQEKFPKFQKRNEKTRTPMRNMSNHKSFTPIMTNRSKYRVTPKAPVKPIYRQNCSRVKQNWEEIYKKEKSNKKRKNQAARRKIKEFKQVCRKLKFQVPRIDSFCSISQEEWEQNGFNSTTESTPHTVKSILKRSIRSQIEELEISVQSEASKFIEKSPSKLPVQCKQTKDETVQNVQVQDTCEAMKFLSIK